MKRSGFKKPQLERKRAPLLPGTGRGVHAASSDVPVTIAKGARVLDEEYRRWVATLPCIRCGIIGFSQAAHPNLGRGLGQKADDTDCFPLCCDRPGTLGCHTMHDQLVKLTLTERRARERTYISIMRKIRDELNTKEYSNDDGQI